MLKEAEQIYDKHSPILVESLPAHKRMVLKIINELYYACETNSKTNHMAFKNSDFDYEQEYRIFISSGLKKYYSSLPGYKYKVSGTTIKHYRNINLTQKKMGEYFGPEIGIKKILLGCNCPEENEEALKMIMAQKGSDKMLDLVKKSNTVFRI